MHMEHRFLRGAVSGLTTAVIGGTRVVEGVHGAILNTVSAVAPVPPPVAPLTRLVYGAIRGVTSVAGLGAEAAVALAAALPRDIQTSGRLQPWQLHVLSAFNAAFGDYFESQEHDWALPMTLCRNGEILELSAECLAAAIPDPSPHVVIFIHGLGMNDLLWESPAGESFGHQIQKETGATVLWLRYNTGRHIFQNGQDLAELLEALNEQYPVAIESLTLVGHSMGGLVSRSATFYGRLFGHHWVGRLKGVVCLGSPHRGAVLENMGNWLTYLLGGNPYSMPLSLIGKSRSAGIKDLRHGSLRHDDWLDRDLDDIRSFTPEPVPLVPGVRYLLVASTWGQNPPEAMAKVIGDGLVRVDSALNPHTGGDGEEVPGQITRLHFRNIGHIRLIHDASVGQALLDWYRRLLDSEAAQSGV